MAIRYLLLVVNVVISTGSLVGLYLSLIEKLLALKSYNLVTTILSLIVWFLFSIFSIAITVPIGTKILTGFSSTMI